MSTDDPSHPSSPVLPAQEGLECLIERLEHLIVGQRTLLERLIIALLAGGHVLIEGVPGLAKTRAVRPWPRRSTCHSDASSSPPTFSPPT